MREKGEEARELRVEKDKMIDSNDKETEKNRNTNRLHRKK